MKCSIKPGIILLFFVLLTGCNKSEHTIYPVSLVCEYITNPQNIDIQNPRLGWKLQPASEEQDDLRQTAYEIICSSTMKKLNRNKGNLWRSGKINSSRSFNIDYKGEDLNSFDNCFWKVRVWDQNGKRSEWSSPARWKMSILDDDIWDQSTWIGLKNDTRESTLKKRERIRRIGRDTVESHPSPLFRKEFKAGKNLRSAYIYISGLGYYNAFINGKQAGDHVLDPGQTSYDVFALYATHNITDFITVGENTIAVTLGNGFFGQNMAFTNSLEYGEPRVNAFIRIEYSDGKEKIIPTDKTWKCATGPVLFDNVYGGETYDAREEKSGWKLFEYDDSQWQNAIEMDPLGKELRSQLLPPMRKIEELSVKRITQINKNTWTLDFGQNISGWARIKVSEKEGTKVTLNYAETLYRGTDMINKESLGGFATGFNQEDIYICRGDGPEIWEPAFTYHGFRYIEISGISSPPDDETVTAILVHSDVSSSGSFECSSPILNQMYETSKWTVVDNLHSIPEDCPHREKCGWLGDAHAVAEFSIFNYDMARFFTKYMADIHSVLGKGKTDENGNPTGAMVPTMVAPGKRLGGEAALDWGVAIVFLPYYMYLYYGNMEVVQNYYGDMKVFIDHMLSFKNEKGYIENGLGDWCPPLWDRRDNPGAMECHPHVSANAFFYKALNIMNLLADKLDDPEYAKWVAEEAEKIKESFNRGFLDPIGDNSLWYGSQTATIMALDFGLVPDSVKNSVTDGLVYDIVVKNNTHHTTGIHGHRPYYSALTDMGLDKLAFEVLTNPTFPSQAYILDAGMTTWPERQWKWKEVEWNRSLNHPMQGGFAAFFHENLLGIKPDSLSPGFKNVVMEPHFINEILWAKGTHLSPYGEISSSWKNSDGNFTWEVTIPPNSGATIHLPSEEHSSVRINGKNLKNHENITIIDEAISQITLKIGSGEYLLESIIQ